MRFILIFLILCTLTLYLCAQSFQPSDSLRYGALKVFFDCPFCDEDHIRREVSLVNYVRDRKEAQVHVMITSQMTGSGGREYSFLFIGQQEFEGQNDTILYITAPDATEEERREGQIRTFKIGLMRYVVKTPVAANININYDLPRQNELVEDRWKSWVFRTGIDGYLDGEKSYKSYSIYGSFSASKITPDWKFDSDYDSGIHEDKIMTDEETVYSTRISHSLNALIVKSLGDHWSIGGTTSLSSSTYSNYQLRYRFYPAIEYDIFPYSESTRKQLTFLYTAGYSLHEYKDSTIYNKKIESFLGQEFIFSLNLIQKWGSIRTSLDASNYFHDWTKNNFSMFTSIEIRIAKGLEFNIGGSASIIHDQLNLVKGEATTEEILLRIKELETSYQYFIFFGISYTFGAIYNNVVNPRFNQGMRFIYYRY